jgi:hypothetical protein
MGEMPIASKILVEKYDTKGNLGDLGTGNIKIDLKYIGCESVD